MGANRHEWIDISRSLHGGMEVYPGDPAAVIRHVQEHDCRVTSLSMSAHTGTHMDAPLHLFPGGASIDRIPLDVCVGPARVVNSLDIVAERMLFKGSQGLRPEEAKRLAAEGVKLVGVDSLSVDRMEDTDLPVHQILLRAGVWIVEGLDLSNVEPGEYDFVCLPLRIQDSDGAPARALLRKR